MATFSVDPPALHGLAAGLERIGEDLAAAGATLCAGPCTGLPGLDDALSELARRWRYGLRRTADAAAGTARQLHRSADVYADVEDRVVVVGR